VIEIGEGDWRRERELLKFSSYYSLFLTSRPVYEEIRGNIFLLCEDIREQDP
jgi:hypothetical protein